MQHQDKIKKRSPLNRLAFKIIAAISISVLVIQLASIDYIENNAYQSDLSNIQEQQIIFTEASAIYIAELIAENNEDSLYLILSAIVANPLIIGATINYTDGRQPLYVGQETSNLEFGFDIKGLNDNDELVLVGKLVTYATTAFIDESRSARYNGILALVLLVFLVVLSVSVIAVQLFVGKPLRLITQAIGNNERVPNIQWNSRDEMGLVVERLNFLHNNLYDELSELEHEVYESDRREAARIKNLANASMEGILLYKYDRVIDLNYPLSHLLQTDRDSLIGKNISDIFSLEIQAFLQQETLENARPTFNTTLVNHAGESIPVVLYLHQLDDDSNGNKVAVIRDISERIAAEKAMWTLAHCDSLTGLPNRRYFSEKLDNAVAFAQEQNLSLSVAYLDLDNFKFINDSRGHLVGDQLLCAVADSLKSTLGGTENCARLGGDEFAILIEENTFDAPLEQAMESVLSGILEGSHCQHWRGIFSVSIGIASASGNALDRGELLTKTDLALYKAKESGRARICFYSDTLDAKLKRKRLIVEKLVPALEQNLFELHYQAQVLIDGSMITGFEALLRWNDPELGYVSPDEIISIAEQEGMVCQIGRWVMSKAIHEAANWPEHIRVAVNLSTLELADENLPQFISDCLNSTNLSADRLEIEITETALISDFGTAGNIIHALKDMGIKIALDDFGTGYSSLSMLQNYPFDRIKIDRSFVSNLSENNNQLFIVANIIDLGARLNLEVIAEGVETESDRAALTQLNCLEFQGYLFSKPVPLNYLPNIIEATAKPLTSDFALKLGHLKKAS